MNRTGEHRGAGRRPATIGAILALAAACASGPAAAAPRMANIFGDHLVLQRDAPTPVWGWHTPGADVVVEFGGQSKTAKAGADGKWLVRLDPMPASEEPRELAVRDPASGERAAAADVLVGDVWLCSGQSNMEMGLGGCSRPEDIQAANLPRLRHIKVQATSAAEPRDDIVRNDWSGRWTACAPGTAGGYTAAGFYFGRFILQHTNVPIGLVNASLGGTLIEPWTPREAMFALAELKPVQDAFTARVGEYRAALPNYLGGLERWIGTSRKALEGVGDLPAMPPPPRHPIHGPGLAANDTPFNLYFGTIRPLVPFAIRGALWYQGESNGGEDDIYRHKMRALVGGWRAAWPQGDFPFYYVQLANFTAPGTDPAGGDGWARLREAQRKAMASITNSGMAVIIDAGEAADIHPKDKRAVGERLARWALHRDYGRADVVPSGPLYRELKVEGGKARLLFDHAAGGLMAAKRELWGEPQPAPDGKLQRFAVAGEDRKWVWADAVIDGETVVVSSPAVPAPVAVRYAFAMNPEGANLYNRAGLPASPFRTDAW